MDAFKLILQSFVLAFVLVGLTVSPSFAQGTGGLSVKTSSVNVGNHNGNGPNGSKYNKTGNGYVGGINVNNGTTPFGSPRPSPIKIANTPFPPLKNKCDPTRVGQDVNCVQDH
ncbi:MAG: hypothetical protein K1X44_07425 [Alphaproteobacteria bacterium]|nr:hypothetical protein [Alphaproteobacteria bacterium]